MKRVVIAIVMLAVIAGVSLYSLYKVDVVYLEMNQRIDAALVAVDSNDQQALYVAVTDLTDYWKIEERKLMHILRHAQIDDITKSMSRLSALAKYRDDSLLLAELDSIRWQVEHIWESEPPTIQNIF